MISKRRKEELRIFELAQIIFKTDKPTRTQLYLAESLSKLTDWLKRQGKTKALLSNKEYVKITRGGTFVTPSEIKAAIKTTKSLFRKLVTASAELPDSMPIGLVPVNRRAYDDDILKNPGLLDNVDTRPYFYGEHEFVYVSASPNGELLRGYIDVQRDKAIGTERQAVIRENGWFAKNLLPIARKPELAQNNTADDIAA